MKRQWQIICFFILWPALVVAAPGDKIGPSIDDELQAAGVMGLPFSWNPQTGQVRIDDPRLTAAQQTSILAVFAAHNSLQFSAAQLAEAAKVKARQDLSTHCTNVEANTTQPATMRTLCQLLRQTLQ